MAQVPATPYAEGKSVDYTPGSAVTGGDVVNLGGLIGIATSDIAANALGSLAVSGLFKVPKTTAAWTVSTAVHWNSTGDPDGGTAGTGAANQLGVGVFMGTASIAAGSGDNYGIVLLNSRAALGGSVAVTDAATATTGGGTTGLLVAGADVFTTVTSDSADKQISLPAGTVGDRHRILVGTTGCELISSVAADKVNEVTVGATNELALTAEALYLCQYTKSGYWIVTGTTKLGAAQSALVPDAL